MRGFDKNDDGKVSYEEFLKFAGYDRKGKRESRSSRRSRSPSDKENVGVRGATSADKRWQKVPWLTFQRA